VNSEIHFTLLVDNLAQAGLAVEHGFSAWIDIGGMRILFDTGAGAALLPNAHRLGIDLGRADALVLSHGHYDHTGGLAQVLALRPDLPLYFGQGMAMARCSCHSGVPVRNIGIRDEDYRVLRALPPEQTRELHAPCELMPHVGLTGPIPRWHPLEDAGGPFFFDGSKQLADPIGDDMAMWFVTERGLVIVTGCCHSGLLNTINYARQITGCERVCGIVGGLHLLHASTERLQATLAGLLALQLDFLIPVHCTGEAQTEALWMALGKSVVKSAQAGMAFTLGRLQ